MVAKPPPPMGAAAVKEQGLIEQSIETAKKATASLRWLAASAAGTSAKCQNTGGAILLRLEIDAVYRGDAWRAAFTRSAIHSFTSDSSQADDIFEILIGLGKVGSV